ncbi:FkbM family methyltransferase [Desulfonatronovibrio magnus]|uniref:FkbM family methyltransferase n=1 Tax=Desulfonatronovibrio magnus TaxID=698827 RepID=UPI000697C423|nr:FkbM family methyltransferase [Desulfonatronovibrio magnus]
MTWLGMPGSMGAGRHIDYVIGDPWVTFQGNADGFSEKIVQLPRSYQPNDHLPPDLTLAGTRQEHGLPEDAFVFCCFNQHYKISPDTFELWLDILRQTDNSVLWLFTPKSEAVKELLMDKMEQANLNPERLVFANHQPQPRHIARLSHADLVLDTWPYNAHTTCSDALRAGTPVISLPGETFASRVAAGILDTSGLSQWIVNTPQEYVQKAVSFAGRHRSQINTDKDQVKNTYWNSAQVDNQAFGLILEALCLGLYDRHAAGKPAVHTGINPDLTLRELTFESATQPDIQQTSIKNLKRSRPAKAETTLQQGGPQARLSNLRILQKQIMKLPTPPLVVDVGAGHFDWDPQLFDEYVEHGLLHCLGFEPDEKSFAKLDQKNDANRKYIKAAIGSGGPAVFHQCNGPHMNSLLEPNYTVLNLFGYKTAKVTGKENVKTITLNEVKEAAGAAMLKLDVQGSELDILKNAEQALQSVVVIQLEAPTLPMYKNQPSLFTLGSFPESKGFVMHNLVKDNRLGYQPDNEKLKTTAKSQLLEVEPVFIPSPLSWFDMSDERLLSLAFIMHTLYNAYDVTLKALEIVDKRDGQRRSLAYSNYLKEAGFSA